MKTEFDSPWPDKLPVKISYIIRFPLARLTCYNEKHMNEPVIIKCALCKKAFPRRKGQVNEAQKFGWSQFCSLHCMAKSKMTGTELICANSECGNKIYRPPKEIKKVTQSFCSRSCSAKINNKLRTALTPENHCVYTNCGLRIKRAQKYCSKFHANKARKVPEAVQRQEAITRINAFYKQHERIPVKREMYGLYKGARAVFGNWNNAITAAGFKPNPVLFARKYVSRDGHKCDSFTEKIIDDWLFAKNIFHQRSLPYPGNKLLSVDFVVGNKWIEFFGLAGELSDYDVLVKRKCRICRRHNIKLIEIYPKDLFPAKKREQIFTKIFKQPAV